MLEGRPAKLPDGSWGAWIYAAVPELVAVGEDVVITSEDGRSWDALIAEIVEWDTATNEALCRVGAGGPSRSAHPEAWKRQQRRVQVAGTLRARARREALVERREAAARRRRIVWLILAGVGALVGLWCANA